MTCQHTISLGAYVLGALDPGDRVELEQHLTACPTCRDELVRFAPIPGLLSHLTEEDLVEAEVGVTRRYQAPTDGPPPRWSPPTEGPPPLPGPRDGGATGPPGRPDPGGPPTPGSRRLARKLRRRTRQRVVLGVVGVLVAGVIAAGGMLGQKLFEKPSPSAAAVTWTATDPATGVKANAQLTSHTWGTEVQLHMDNLPVNQRCQLVVHAKDGTTETAGWWHNDYPGSETVPASSSMSVDKIQYMDVINTSNNVLVRLQPH